MNSNKKDEIFHFLNLGEYDEVIRLTKSKKNNTLDFFKYKKCDNKNIGFAYNIFNACLIGRLDPKNYSAIHNLSFKTEYQEELDELIEILLVIENSSKIPEYETLVSLTILECVRNGVEYISKNSNNYPLNAIKSKTWLDGASLREKAQLLSKFFLRKNDEKK